MYGKAAQDLCNDVWGRMTKEGKKPFLKRFNKMKRSLEQGVRMK